MNTWLTGSQCFITPNSPDSSYFSTISRAGWKSRLCRMMLFGQSPLLKIQEPLWFQVKDGIDYNWSLTLAIVENILDWLEASLIESMALLLAIFRKCLLKEAFWLYVFLFLRYIWSFNYFCRTEQKLWKHLEVCNCNKWKKGWPWSQKIFVYFLALVFSSCGF